MSALPEGWASTTLGEICSKPQYGWTTKGIEHGRIKLLRTTDITKGVIDWSSVPFCAQDPPARSKYQLAEDDIVISRAGSVGVSALLQQPIPAAVFASYLIRFKALGILPRFTAYYLQSPRYWAAISENAAGIAIPNVNATKLAALRIPLAPFREQHRIVAKIESLFAKLDEGVAALKRAEANLERYRASVLKAAVEGRLTEQWRRENPPEETAEVLLRRIQAPPRPGRYRTRFKGVIPGHAALSVGATHSRLPQHWSWAPLVDVARLESGHTPSRRRPEWWGGDVPWVGIKDARAHHGGTIFETLQTTNEDGLANSAARLLPRNTVCLSRTASVGYVVVLARPMATSQDFVNWICTEALEPRWLQIVLLADSAALRRFGKGSTHTTVYFPEVLSLHVAVPPLAEQRAIVAEVDARLSEAADQEALIRDALQRSSILRQSILKRAFEGRLVPQDPADAPASVLLERIRAEREAERRRSKRRPTKPRRQRGSRVP